ncbi:MAG: 3-dehydroquinate synthase [Bacteroidales bacterium]|nr:3-dehydroquinate synthase [Bacteroidales bacterium]
MKNSTFTSNRISLSEDIAGDLMNISIDFLPDKIFLLFDENTYAKCRDDLGGFINRYENQILVIKYGEKNKTLEQAQAVWHFLGEHMADRKSLLVNIGGGMLTDLGGFAASAFKRGMQFINVPTTILAMVDASVGGKTGVNFRGLKNEIGSFKDASHVFLYPPFLKTLDDENFRSGIAEMLKAALIKDEALWTDLKAYDLNEKSLDLLAPLLWRSVMVKKEIVDLDPEEKTIRKALNFGHTIGHALESLALHSGVSLSHGFAVAYGMVVEAKLSNSFATLSYVEQEDVTAVIVNIYGKPPEQLNQPQKLIDYMRFDKKNEENHINFTLLKRIGSFSINNFIEPDDILEALSTIFPG